MIGFECCQTAIGDIARQRLVMLLGFDATDHYSAAL